MEKKDLWDILETLILYLFAEVDGIQVFFMFL